MYKKTKEGKELKDQFVEFYFSTGLYNYYIEAYPEAHPVYKPLLAFMQKGDKELGLEQLNYAINQTVFLKVEAILFMSLIQLKYEKDLNSAAIYARRLHQDYPNNTYYQGHLLTILLHQHRHMEAQELLAGMEGQNDAWSNMNRTLAAAFMAEADRKEKAEEEYQRLLRSAENFGPIADIYTAMAYMGLSRLKEQKGMENEARKYARKAGKYTTYEFILSEQMNVSR
jgi:predicted Zn-dependent protease